MIESRSHKRARFIEYIYYFELMGEDFTYVNAFEFGNFNEKDIKMLEALEKNYVKFKKLISNYLSNNWTLERVSPLERAILIFGAFELSFSEKKITINELVSYTKGFVPGDNYKFINAILDKVGAYYEKAKSNQETN